MPLICWYYSRFLGIFAILELLGGYKKAPLAKPKGRGWIEFLEIASVALLICNDAGNFRIFVIASEAKQSLEILDLFLEF